MRTLSISNNLSQLIDLLWVQGKWSELADLYRKKDNYSENEKAYIAIALFQENRLEDAKSLLMSLVDNSKFQEEKSRAFKKRIETLLLSSCYTSLSNVWHINGDDVRGKELATKAVKLVSPLLLQDSFLQLRCIQQREHLYELGVKREITSWSTPEFNVSVLKKLPLGKAWAGNTVNTVIFRHHGVFSKDSMQYTAFYIDDKTLCLAQRDLSNNKLIFFNIRGNYNIKDAHNSISLGMDREGYVHISYDHHGTNLKYRRSLNPHSILGFTNEMRMTGQREMKVTYPTFLNPMTDEPLMLLYRDGYDRKGAAYIKIYCEKEHRWSDGDSAILAGDTNQPWTSNAYWNHPVRDSEGNAHLSFIWRTDHIGEEQQINNMNICYAKTYDNCKSWHSSNNKPFKLPITQVNAEVVWPMSPANNLINQTGMAVDSKNRPHIVFYANDESGIVQYQHLWFNGRKWQHQIISKRTSSFDLYGGGTLRIPISRPDIVIDKHDNVFVIYRGDLTEDCMAALCLKSPHYTYNPANQQILCPEPVGLAEPVIDRLRWQEQQILSLLVQYNDQPNYDVDHTPISKPIYLLDVIFNM